MAQETHFDKLRIATFIIGFVVAISLLTAIMLGPAIGNTFIAGGQDDILLSQEQHDLDTAQSQIFRASPVLGSEMVGSMLLAEVGILSLILTALYARFRGRFFIAGFVISSVCGIGLLGIARLAQQLMTTTSAIKVYPLTGNPWDKNRLISLVQGFAGGAQSTSNASLLAGLVLIASTALSFALILYRLHHKAERKSLDS